VTDLLFKTPDYIFSYRVAGICIRDGKVLLQSCEGDPGYAFPGGHVAYGETHEEALKREFAEETGLDVQVGELKMLGELFFRWGSMPCQQICLYYQVSIDNDKMGLREHFNSIETKMGSKPHIQFHWIPICNLSDFLIYPSEAVAHLQTNQEDLMHFIYREE